jgi:prepilin-type N-terminal cleavage/methylation domain-containing protein
MRSLRSLPIRRGRSAPANVTGFTLIELICVLVILGVLSAVALPRMIDLSGTAKIAAFKGLLGDARSKAELVRMAALLVGAGGSVTRDGCTATLDATGSGNVCLGTTAVSVYSHNMSCYNGMWQATAFKGPYQTGTNSTITYHTNGDQIAGVNYWTHTDSGCTFTCRVGADMTASTSLTVTLASCK